ncbi:MAG: hypothetical protein DBP00_16235 [gamma proteobacterium symbiont of Ctena orbiculata]|nr:MAG: hypothetical protein DBP00_16235 [gamma proteobacterium symbiont of Ctena orbiculata]
MRVDAPNNKTRATASINWLTRQLKKLPDSDLIIKAIWPGRVPDTQCSLTKTLEDPTALVPDGMKSIPKSFEVIRVVDLGAKFKGQKVFVESTIPTVRTFYQDVGEKVTKWIAPPPKTKNDNDRSQNNSFSEINIEADNSKVETIHTTEKKELIAIQQTLKK